MLYSTEKNINTILTLIKEKAYIAELKSWKKGVKKGILAPLFTGGSQVIGLLKNKEIKLCLKLYEYPIERPKISAQGKGCRNGIKS